MTAFEFAPRQSQTEQLTVHVLWMTSGLGCDGDTVAMTSPPARASRTCSAAYSWHAGRLIYNQFLATYGDDFMRRLNDAEAGKLDPFILVLQGAVPTSGSWRRPLGRARQRPRQGQPITTNQWIDAGAARADRAGARHLRGLRRRAGDENNPTGAMGLRDHLGHEWRSRAGLPVVNLPGCPAQPDNITETLLYLVLQIAGTTQRIELDEQGRPAWLFERTVHEVCNRAGFADHGDYADNMGDDPRCLVKFGCKGPVVRCNVPRARLTGGVGGCPNVGGICMACTMPGFPDKYMRSQERAVGEARGGAQEPRLMPVSNSGMYLSGNPGIVHAMQMPPTLGHPPIPLIQPRAGTLHLTTGPLQPNLTRQPASPNSSA